VAYSEIPIGLALILCDTVIEDRHTMKKSLIGLFSQIRAASFPYTHPLIHLVVSLTGGKGDYPCEVLCQHDDLKTKVFSIKNNLRFRSHDEVAELVYNLKSLTFPRPGRYWFKVLLDDMPIMMRPVLVVSRQEAKPPPPPNRPGRPPSPPPPPPSPPEA